MADDKLDTEKVILEAARKVFIKKGLDGARMQEIADEAGINKALLHYYFRSKDKLFEIIFRNEISSLFPAISSVLISSEISIEDKIRVIVEKYITIFINNPFLPSFIIREINRDPENLKLIFERAGVNLDFIHNVALKRLCEMFDLTFDGARDFIVNILSLCIFPFAAKPLIEKILFNESKEDYSKFLQDRKDTVAEFIISAVKGSRRGNQPNKEH